MDQAAVIVAGGKGSRMQSDIPKQFLPLNGKPLLFHTLQAFYSYDSSIPIWLVLPASEHHYWKELCRKYGCNVPHEIVAGGSCRPQSVKNGIAQIQSDNCLVAVHDGVRPMVTKRMIEDSFTVAGKFGSAIASIPLKDSIRQVKSDGTEAKNRASFRLVQTPQTFRIDWLRTAYEKLEVIESFSDEASLVEAAGRRVTLYEGDNRNLKVTTPEDLIIAEALFKQKASE